MMEETQDDDSSNNAGRDMEEVSIFIFHAYQMSLYLY